MLLQDIKWCWILAVSIIILLNGTLFKISICDASGNEAQNNTICQHKKILAVAMGSLQSGCHFSSDELHDESNGIKLCVVSNQNKTQAGCCNIFGYDCGFEIEEIPNQKYRLTLMESTLSTQDIVIMTTPMQTFKCTPSHVYNHSGFLLNPKNCLDSGDKNIRVTKDNIFGNNVSNDDQGCEGADGTKYRIIITRDPNRHFRCMMPEEPDVSIILPSSGNNNITTIDTAVNIFNNLSYLVEKMGESNTAAVTIGNVQGIISKLHPKNQSHINMCITTRGDFNFCGTNTTLANNFSLSVHIPKEASTMAMKRNGSFAAVFRFTEMEQDEDVVLLNNEMLGIDMGVNISNLTDTIDIKYGNVEKGKIASCQSWDGKGKNPIWIPDGCKTLQSNGNITCQCSHLTFFAVLMSPPPGNISSSDFRSLSYITSIGCGVSMFFLAVALFMHFTIRKNRVSLGIKILMNLFLAMFTLNLTFLTNELIANLEIFGACVTIAVFTHYFMLATITWFFMEALHLYFNLWKNPADIKHYMMKICVTGWVTPAAVVIVLLALRMYDYMVIYIDDGNSAKMCWISNPILHQAVNVGYYGVVFIFTICIFIATVQTSLRFKAAIRKSQDNNSVNSNSFSILGLFIMLGITWAFAFFSHGPLLIASYYIFTILNSFQGFFLFIYYIKSSKTVAEKEGSDKDTSSTVASNITLNSISK